MTSRDHGIARLRHMIRKSKRNAARQAAREAAGLDVRVSSKSHLHYAKMLQKHLDHLRNY